jgi:hypothetical protein
MKTKKKRLSPDLSALAKEIAQQLFTDGIGRRADRLVLHRSDWQMCGGWSESLMANHIKKILREHLGCS